MGANMDGVDSLHITLDDTKDDWVDENVTWVVGTSVEHGLFIEYGTRPHTITPNDAEVLQFTVGGTTVYTDIVEHPGTEASPFLRPALDRARNNIPSIAKRATSLSDLVRRLALFVERESKRILVENGNVDTGQLLNDVAARRVE